MTTEQRIAKFVKQAPKIAGQDHLDKIVASFAPDDRPIAIAAVSGILPAKLVAREVEVEFKPKDEQNPTIQESTAQRLNSQAAKIVEQSDTIAEMDARIKLLEKELADEKVKEKR